MIGFSFPVVPRARRASAPRCRAAHTRADSTAPSRHSARSGRELGVIPEWPARMKALVKAKARARHLDGATCRCPRSARTTC